MNTVTQVFSKNLLRLDLESYDVQGVRMDQRGSHILQFLVIATTQVIEECKACAKLS